MTETILEKIVKRSESYRSLHGVKPTKLLIGKSELDQLSHCPVLTSYSSTVRSDIIGGIGLSRAEIYGMKTYIVDDDSYMEVVP